MANMSLQAGGGGGGGGYGISGQISGEGVYGGAGLAPPEGVYGGAGMAPAQGYGSVVATEEEYDMPKAWQQSTYDTPKS